MRTMSKRTYQGRGNGTKLSAILALAIAVVLLFSSLAVDVHALGASPAWLSFESVLPGGYAEASVLISNPRDQSASVTATVKGSQWISATMAISNKTSNRTENKTDNVMVLPAHGTARLIVTVTPPADAEPGNYSANVVLSTMAVTGGASGGASSSLALRMAVPVTISVASNEQPSCILGGVSIPDFERGESLQLRYAIKDDGNTRISPVGMLTVKDAEGSEVYVATVDVQGEQATLPTRTNEYLFVATPSLAVGTYNARLSINQCGKARETTFSVVAPGTLKSSGSFTALSSEENSTQDSILPVTADFRNSGERVVTAKFSGVVVKDGEVVKVLESDPLLVSPGKGVTFQSFFSPTAPGNYTVRGSIVYEGKRTEERSFTISVTDTQTSGWTGNLSVTGATLLFFIVIALIVLLVLIQNRRQRK